MWFGWLETEHSNFGMAIWVASKWTWSHMEIILGNVPCLRRMPNGTCNSERHQFLPRFHWKGKIVNLLNQNANGWMVCRCVSFSLFVCVGLFFSLVTGPLRFSFFFFCYPFFHSLFYSLPFYFLSFHLFPSLIFFHHCHAILLNCLTFFTLIYVNSLPC